jgi:hypothetical protein
MRVPILIATALLALPMTPAVARSRHHSTGYHCPLGQYWRPSMRACSRTPWAVTYHGTVFRHSAARVIVRTVYRTKIIYDHMAPPHQPSQIRSKIAPWAGALKLRFQSYPQAQN